MHGKNVNGNCERLFFFDVDGCMLGFSGIGSGVTNDRGRPGNERKRGVCCFVMDGVLLLRIMTTRSTHNSLVR